MDSTEKRNSGLGLPSRSLFNPKEEFDQLEENLQGFYQEIQRSYDENQNPKNLFEFIQNFYKEKSAREIINLKVEQIKQDDIQVHTLFEELIPQFQKANIQQTFRIIFKILDEKKQNFISQICKKLILSDQYESPICTPTSNFEDNFDFVSIQYSQELQENEMEVLQRISLEELPGYLVVRQMIENLKNQGEQALIEDYEFLSKLQFFLLLSFKYITEKIDNYQKNLSIPVNNFANSIMLNHENDTKTINLYSTSEQLTSSKQFDLNEIQSEEQKLQEFLQLFQGDFLNCGQSGEGGQGSVFQLFHMKRKQFFMAQIFKTKYSHYLEKEKEIYKKIKQNQEIQQSFAQFFDLQKGDIFDLKINDDEADHKQLNNILLMQAGDCSLRGYFIEAEKNNVEWKVNEVFSIIEDLGYQVENFNSESIYHADIKDMNVIITKQQELKFIDLGSAELDYLNYGNQFITKDYFDKSIRLIEKDKLKEVDIMAAELFSVLVIAIQLLQFQNYKDTSVKEEALKMCQDLQKERSQQFDQKQYDSLKFIKQFQKIVKKYSNKLNFRAINKYRESIINNLRTQKIERMGQEDLNSMMRVFENYNMGDAEIQKFQMELLAIQMKNFEQFSTLDEIPKENILELLFFYHQQNQGTDDQFLIQILKKYKQSVSFKYLSFDNLAVAIFIKLCFNQNMQASRVINTENSEPEIDPNQASIEKSLLIKNINYISVIKEEEYQTSESPKSKRVSFAKPVKDSFSDYSLNNSVEFTQETKIFNLLIKNYHFNFFRQYNKSVSLRDANQLKAQLGEKIFILLYLFEQIVDQKLIELFYQESEKLFAKLFRISDLKVILLQSKYQEFLEKYHLNFTQCDSLLEQLIVLNEMQFGKTDLMITNFQLKKAVNLAFNLNRKDDKVVMQLVQESIDMIKKSKDERQERFLKNAYKNQISILKEIGKLQQANAFEQEYSQFLLNEDPFSSINNTCEECHFLMNNGKLQQALQLGYLALKMAMEMRGPKSDLYASCLSDLAQVYLRKGDIRKAQEKMQTCLSIRQQQFKSDPANEKLILSHSGWAIILKAEGNYNKSEIEFIKILETLEQHAKDKGEKIAEALSDLGELYQDWGKYDLAIENFKQSQTILRSLPDTPLVEVMIAKREKNLGRAYFFLRDFNQAKIHFEWCYQYYLQEYDGNIELADILYSLGITYHRLKNLDKAQTHLGQSIQIYKQDDMTSTKFENFSVALLSLAAVYQEQKKPQQAIEILREVDQFLDTSDHWIIKQAYEKIFSQRAQILKKQKDYTAITEHLSEFINILEQFEAGNGKDFHLLLSTFLHCAIRLANNYLKIKAKQQALETLEKAKKIQNQYQNQQTDDISDLVSSMQQSIKICQQN